MFKILVHVLCIPLELMKYFPWKEGNVDLFFLVFLSHKNDILTLQNKGNMTIAFYLPSVLIMQLSEEGCGNITLPALFRKKV